MVTHFKTNFSPIVQKIREHGYTWQQIVDLSGLSTVGHAHDIGSGRREQMNYDTGIRLMAEYKKLISKERRRK
jgi:hypothetical protein